MVVRNTTHPIHRCTGFLAPGVQCIETRLDQFRAWKNSPDGLSELCHACRERQNMSQLGKYHYNSRARGGNLYSNMCHRVTTRLYRRKGIQVRCTREEFIEWYVVASAKYEKSKEFAADPTRHGTIDRIDNDGHYELSNMRIVSPAVNNANRGPGSNGGRTLAQTMGRRPSRRNAPALRRPAPSGTRRAATRTPRVARRRQRV